VKFVLAYALTLAALTLMFAAYLTTVPVRTIVQGQDHAIATLVAENRGLRDQVRVMTDGPR
jgi:hypothetical protein